MPGSRHDNPKFAGNAAATHPASSWRANAAHLNRPVAAQHSPSRGQTSEARDAGRTAPPLSGRGARALRSGVQSDGSASVRWNSIVPNANASAEQCTPADGAAGLADGGSGHADTANPGSAGATAESNLRHHAVRLRNRRRCHGVRRRRDGQGKAGNSDRPDHCFPPFVAVRKRAHGVDESLRGASPRARRKNPSILILRQCRTRT